MEPKLITTVHSHAFMVAMLLASSMLPAIVAYRVNATCIEYQPELANWEWTSKRCSDLNSDVSLAFRQRHRWAEFCGDLCPYRGSAGCHKCLEVTNAEIEDGASVKVRIIDICNFNPDEDPVIWMDKVAFDQIDTDDQAGTINAIGMRVLQVNYVKTECEDEE